MLKRNVRSFLSLKAHRAALSFLSPQPDSSLHCETTRSVPVYIPAFAGIHCTYPWRDGQAELTWVARYVPVCQPSPIQVLTRIVTILLTTMMLKGSTELQ